MAGESDDEVDWEAVGEAIRAARRNRGLSQVQVGELLGVTGAAVSNWEKGKDLNYSRLLALRSHLQFDASAVDVQLGEMLIRDVHFAQVVEDILAKHLIPQVDQEELAKSDFDQFVNCTSGHHFYCSGESYAVVLDERANIPEFHPGDVVVIDPEIDPRPEDMVMVALEADKAPIFRRLQIVRRGDGVEYLLVPVNTAWPTQSLSAGEAYKIIGVMAEHARPRK